MNQKRVGSVLLSVALVLSLGTGTVAAEEVKTPLFSDISGHWAKDTIQEAAELKIVGGYPDGTFLPQNLIKREEFFALLTNILTKKPDITQTKIDFKDVKDGAWYEPIIKMAIEEKMTSGYPDKTFGIGRMMSRQEAAQVAATVLAKGTVTSGAGVSLAKDKDKIADWAYAGVDLMFKKGYMKGDNQGNFRPTMAITRAEAVQILLHIQKNEAYVGAKADEILLEQKLVGCVPRHLPLVNGVADVSAQALAKLPKGTFAVGRGTVYEPYEITTQEQLDHVRMHNQAGVYFKLMKDITVTQDFATKAPEIGEIEADWRLGNWQPIGSREAPFVGSFEGNNHTISGLLINSAGDKTAHSKALESDASGFVGWLGGEGRIANLRIAESRIQNTGAYSGMVAGVSRGTITNCTAESSVTVEGVNYTGGLVGDSENKLEECTNYGAVTGKGKYTGGVCGSYTAGVQSLLKCYNRGRITGNEAVGGVAGGVASTEAAAKGGSVWSCMNYGKVDGGSYSTGGVVGLANGSGNSVSLYECENKGTVNSKGVSGGVLGHSQGYRVTVEQCQNSGDVKGNSAGGVVGNNEGNVQLSINRGNVDGSIFLGGIVAFQNGEKSKIIRCRNEGNVGSDSNASNVGGLVGENEALIVNSYNTGKVEGVNNIGGIAGKNMSRISNVYTTGKIHGQNEVGALTGRNGGTLADCFWLKGAAQDSIGGGQTDSGVSRVYMLSEEELSGKKDIRTNKGTEQLLKAMNQYSGEDAAPIWEYENGYDYPQLIDLPQ